MQHISGGPGLASDFTRESSSNNLKFRIKKADAFIYSSVFTPIHFPSRTWLRLRLLSVGGYLREVCCVVVKPLLKLQPLFSSLRRCVGFFAGTTAGETSQRLPVATERLSYLFWMIQPRTMKDPPPAQVDIPGTEAREVVGFQEGRS